MGNACGGAPDARSGGKDNSENYKFVPPEHHVDDIWDKFDNAGELGKGASCAVYKVKEKGGGNKWLALKQMIKDDEWNPKLFTQEVEILQQLKHPNILAYQDAWIDRNNFYINTVLCTGGELFDRIKELKFFPEPEGCRLMYTLISAMHHCHCKNIVHRDLKPENIVFQDGNYNKIVIIDFGDAVCVDEKQVYEDFVGTAFYLAPECVRSRRGWELMKSDMWTCGVICYVLLTGRPPFYGRDNREILKKILKAKLTFPKGKKQPPLSTNCKDFIKSLVKSDTTKRYDAARALKHKWLKEMEPTFPELKERHQREQQEKTRRKSSSNKPNEEEKQAHFPAPIEDILHVDEGDDPHFSVAEGQVGNLSKRVLQKLLDYQCASKLKRVLSRVRCSQYSAKQHKYYTHQFSKLDKDGDGGLGWLDLTAHLDAHTRSYQSDSIRVRSVLQAITGKEDGTLNLEHYQQAIACACLQEDVVVAREFARIDIDGDGYISKSDLLATFSDLPPTLVGEIMSESDLDKDGRLSMEEFRRAMMLVYV